MSYLQGPRICFHGRFQCDTSTINNFVNYYDVQRFQKVFQDLMEFKDGKQTKTNGYWNPDGTGAFRLLGCQVSSATLGRQCFTEASQDPVIGMLVGGSNDRVAAKMVDLDPQQQLVSQIWGLSVRLQNAEGQETFSGQLEPAAFSNLWARQQKKTHWFDQTLATAFQSVLNEVEWSGTPQSPTLAALQKLSDDGMLSIRMNVLGFDRTPGADDYATGKIVGSIGPAFRETPKLFTIGRHLTPTFSDPYGFGPKHGIGPVDAVVDEKEEQVTVDFGNALPTAGSSGELSPVSQTPLEFVILKNPGATAGDSISPDEMVSLGEIPFSGTNWFATAGIASYSLSDNEAARTLIGGHPLAVVQTESTGHKTILNRETSDGLFLKADHFVFRMNTGETAQVDIWASRYGKGIETSIELSSTQGLLGFTGKGSNFDEEKFPPPPVCTPDGVVGFPKTISTDTRGRASFQINTSPDGPGNPRHYIDGQLYGIAYQFPDGSGGTQSNIQHFISILAWDKYTAPEQPVWYQDVQPILRQYANLYPIMSHGLFDLADYDKVVQYLKIMELCFNLPLSDPNSMPVTRDMSEGKRAMIVKWLGTKDPQTGLPCLGTPPEKPSEETPPDSSGMLEQIEGEACGKYEFARIALEQSK